MTAPQPERRQDPDRLVDARARILAAARRRFAEQGVHATSLRAVAGDARVDVALISHYFGSKSGLFSATMELPELATSVVTDALTMAPEARGETLTRDFLQLWEDPETGGAMRVVGQAALTEPDARTALHGVMAGDLHSAEFRSLTQEQVTGLASAMSFLLGVAVARYLVQTPVLSSLDVDELVQRVAPAVQLQLDGMAGRPPRPPVSGESSPAAHGGR